jgi:hypothetical protein
MLQNPCFGVLTISDNYIERTVFAKPQKPGIQILERRAQIRIREENTVTARMQHSVPNSESLSSLFVMRQDDKLRIAYCGLFGQRESSIVARFNDDDDLVPKFP